MIQQPTPSPTPLFKGFARLCKEVPMHGHKRQWPEECFCLEVKTPWFPQILSINSPFFIGFLS
ncbi:MAG: hypothetical protein ACOC4B_02645 [Bacteroidota bacterium]